ncbi:MAG: VPLPA-CTERM sorting domain-containing protein, partial [Phycisphaerae bacterium]|nr:VPLPA-CTERM sorting domain-containing protein [Phycisphaerae bacterium]
MRCVTLFAAAGLILATMVTPAEAVSVRTNAGFNTNTFARNDDSYVAGVSIGFTIDFWGSNYSTLWVNNNGNVTFDAGLGTYTPFDLTSTGQQIIAPFFADVDTYAHGEPVRYGTDTVGGHNAFGVNWIDVDYYSSSSSHGSQLNTFQLVMIDRSDINPGDFDFEFNYDQILWETGDASGGYGGLGGYSARAGYSNGTGDPGTFLELYGSAINGAFLDTNSCTGLIYNSLNSTVDGRYVFEVRNGQVQLPIPEPLTMLAV